MSIELTESIGRAVREARGALGLTQQDVAERLGISAQFYGRIERGHALPSVATLVRMMRVLGVSADALMGHNGRTNGEKRRRPRAPRESPELRRLLRTLRKASPDTIRVVCMLVDELPLPDDDDC